ncbi:MAG: VWA domain-containing protein [Promethearchaeota archaeon]|nr:MAG: VWA domain-containing protein [Candidatus Lokiarchaeota archaeon]
MYKPSIRQAIAICKLILARFLNRGICEVEDYVEIAAVTSPLENQDLARKIAKELLTYLESKERKISGDLNSSDFSGSMKPKQLIDDLGIDLDDLDEIYDDLEFLKNNFDEIEDLDLDDLVDSTFDNFFDKFRDELEEDPYKTALDVIDRNAIANFDKFQDLDSLLDYAKDLLRKKIDHLEPEDINFAEKLDMLDEIIKNSNLAREKILSQFAKNQTTRNNKAPKAKQQGKGVDNFDFKTALEKTFQDNFYDALNVAEFAIKGKLVDDNRHNIIKDLFKQNLCKSNRNLNDLLNATRVMGSKMSLGKQELDKIVGNSLDLPFKDAYQSVKSHDQFFGGNLSEKYLDKINNSFDNFSNNSDLSNIRNHLIGNPIKIPSWRKLLSNVIDKEVQSIKKDFSQKGVLNAQMKNYADTLINKKDNCPDFVCRSQLNKKIQDVVNQSTELAVNKENLRNLVKNFNEMGFLPHLDSIKKAGKRLNMTEAEILSLIEADYKYFKQMVEERSTNYQGYRDYLKQLKLSPQQVDQVVRTALGDNPPQSTNLDALSALNEKYLSQVLNTAEQIGDQALDMAFSSLGAGSGLDLLEQWFFSRHNISAKVKRKLKEIIKQIMIDLGIRSANSLIGSANSGPIVENIVIPYTPGDDFELIDLEETVSNLLEGGKTVETITNDDFLISKTTQGLRCLVMELDISGSMTGQKLSQMALCTTMLVYAFKPEELALTFFESNTHKIKDLEQEIELEKVVDELLDISARGGTCINSALKWANHQFDKKARSKHKLNILFTDADVFDFKNSLGELKKMSEKDVKFVMVVPKFGFSPVMAKKMVEEANGVLLTLNQWRDFPKLISEIITNQ